VESSSPTANFCMDASDEGCACMHKSDEVVIVCTAVTCLTALVKARGFDICIDKAVPAQQKSAAPLRCSRALLKASSLHPVHTCALQYTSGGRQSRLSPVITELQSCVIVANLTV